MRKTLYQHILDLLDERHVDLARMAQIAYESQLPYEPDITLEKCKQAILHVLEKREVQNVVLTGIVVDKMVDMDLIPDEYLAKILKEDSWQYQVDEVVSYGIGDVFGGIANSNRGYLDKAKPGIIGEVDRRKRTCNVFLDDILSSIIASAESYIGNKEDQGAYAKFGDGK